MKYIGKYADATAIQNALNAHTLGNPYIAFNVATNALDWNTLTDQNIPLNQIWYKTSDNSIINITGGTGSNNRWGATVASNTYDPDSGYCKVVFNGNITRWGSPYGYNEFAKKSVLTEIIIPPSITTIIGGDGDDGYGNYKGFQLNRNLIKAYIPDTVTTFSGDSTFTSSGIVNLHLSNNLTSISNYCFAHCGALKSINSEENSGIINLPSSITSIGEEAFRGCNNNVTLNIPDSVSSIGERGWFESTNIKNVNIGTGIQSIGSYTFSLCTNIETVTITAVVPPTIGYTIFYGITDFTIYVPAASVNAYKTATNWSAYADKIQAIPE